MVNVEPLPVFSDNYVWILSNVGSPKSVVVDPGDAATVMTYFAESYLECVAIFLTHHHQDHTGGAEELRDAWTCPVFGPGDESIPAVTNPVDEGTVVSAGGMDFEVLSVPGHTRGHIAFAGQNLVLCGDALFAGGCGRIFEGTPSQMFESLGRLAALDPETVVCCAHEYTVANLEFAVTVEPGNNNLVSRLNAVRATRDAGRPTLPSKLREELATNPFLRCNQLEVVQSASSHAGRSLKPGVETFTEIRRWKDSYP